MKGTSTLDRPVSRVGPLGTELVALSATLSQCQFELVTTAAAFAESPEWVLGGSPTAAHWLAAVAGVEACTAREWICIGKALTALPVTTAAFAERRLSYSKIRTLTRKATPENEAELVELIADVPADEVGRVIAAENFCERVVSVSSHGPRGSHVRQHRHHRSSARHCVRWGRGRGLAEPTAAPEESERFRVRRRQPAVRGVRPRRWAAMTDSPTGTTPAPDPAALLRDPSYVGLVVLGAITGVPVAAAAYLFLQGVAEVQKYVFETLPSDVGFDAAPGWWPILPLALRPPGDRA